MVASTAATTRERDRVGPEREREAAGRDGDAGDVGPMIRDEVELRRVQGDGVADRRRGRRASTRSPGTPGRSAWTGSDRATRSPTTCQNWTPRRGEDRQDRGQGSAAGSCVATSRRRRSTRSARTPATSESSRIGAVAGGAGQPQQRRRVGQLEDEPALRRRLHPVADVADERAGDESPVDRRRQRRQARSRSGRARTLRASRAGRRWPRSPGPLVVAPRRVSSALDRPGASASSCRRRVPARRRPSDRALGDIGPSSRSTMTGPNPAASSSRSNASASPTRTIGEPVELDMLARDARDVVDRRPPRSPAGSGPARRPAARGRRCRTARRRPAPGSRTGAGTRRRGSRGRP